jgi:hypothetical protein
MKNVMCELLKHPKNEYEWNSECVCIYNNKSTVRTFLCDLFENGQHGVWISVKRPLIFSDYYLL